MFTDESFKVKCELIWSHDLHVILSRYTLDRVDKRGKKVSQSSTENMKKYYQLDEGK